jgi:hypothetical protein
MALTTDESMVEVESSTASDADTEADTVLIAQPEPPRGYAFGARGGVFLERMEEDADGHKVTKQLLLCSNTIFPVDVLNNNGSHEVHFCVVKNNQMHEVLVPQKCMASKDETIKHLANQNVMASFGSGNDQNFFAYIRASVEKISIEKNPIKMPPSYGWQEDDTFVFASRVYSANQKPVMVPISDLQNIVASTKPTGSLDAWRNVINMMVRRKMWDQLAVVLAGAAAPLMRFTGLLGMTVHVASTS